LWERINLCRVTTTPKPLGRTPIGKSLNDWGNIKSAFRELRGEFVSYIQVTQVGLREWFFFISGPETSNAFNRDVCA
jgi:hypothetical protein